MFSFSVFKVFSIGENDFSEVCNLRVGKNLNLNFSSIDVAWSTIEGMLIKPGSEGMLINRNS